MGKVIKKGALGPGELEVQADLVEAPVHRAPIIERSTYEARSEAQQIIGRAGGEAEEIRQQAEHEADAIRQQARDEGYAEGRAQGAAELAEVIAGIVRRQQQIEAQAVPQLKELALTIARKILGRELEFSPEAVVDIVKQALSEKARQRREIFLRVNPADMQAIREHKAELLEILSRAKEIGIREDPDVQRHGVIIETDAGIIDAQLETQLEVFERVLRETH